MHWRSTGVFLVVVFLVVGNKWKWKLGRYANAHVEFSIHQRLSLGVFFFFWCACLLAYLLVWKDWKDWKVGRVGIEWMHVWTDGLGGGMVGWSGWERYLFPVHMFVDDGWEGGDGESEERGGELRYA
ncbi:hypothetical protein ACMFMG_008975 [Clarireedia jacksonii]